MHVANVSSPSTRLLIKTKKTDSISAGHGLIEEKWNEIVVEEKAFSELISASFILQ